MLNKYGSQAVDCRFHLLFVVKLWAINYLTSFCPSFHMCKGGDNSCTYVTRLLGKLNERMQVKHLRQCFTRECAYILGVI